MIAKVVNNGAPSCAGAESVMNSRTNDERDPEVHFNKKDPDPGPNNDRQPVPEYSHSHDGIGEKIQKNWFCLCFAYRVFFTGKKHQEKTEMPQA
jgi:hypothetical protein